MSFFLAFVWSEPVGFGLEAQGGTDPTTPAPKVKSLERPPQETNAANAVLSCVICGAEYVEYVVCFVYLFIFPTVVHVIMYLHILKRLFVDEIILSVATAVANL